MIVIAVPVFSRRPGLSYPIVECNGMVYPIIYDAGKFKKIYDAVLYKRVCVFERIRTTVYADEFLDSQVRFARYATCLDIIEAQND